MTQTPKHFLYHIMTQTERHAWIVASRTNLGLADLLLHASCAERINTSNPEFIGGIAVLVSEGILTQARADEILAE
jgi:hypothetical protein